MVSYFLCRWSFACQNLTVFASNRAKTTRTKSDILETLVILMPDFSGFFSLLVLGLRGFVVEMKSLRKMQGYFQALGSMNLHLLAPCARLSS